MMQPTRAKYFTRLDWRFISCWSLALFCRWCITATDAICPTYYFLSISLNPYTLQHFPSSVEWSRRNTFRCSRRPRLDSTCKLLRLSFPWDRIERSLCWTSSNTSAALVPLNFNRWCWFFPSRYGMHSGISDSSSFTSCSYHIGQLLQTVREEIIRSKTHPWRIPPDGNDCRSSRAKADKKMITSSVTWLSFVW